jgi:arylsulfatase A
MCRRGIGSCLAVLLVIAAAGNRQACAADAQRPNIVFILGDDYGIDGVGCYGSDRGKTLTPNIDALARSGTRFERCYSMPVCGPSRCLLMTGRYGFRTGGLTNQSAGQPSYYNEPSLATILKQAGYATGMAGKWRQMGDSPGDWGFGEYVTDPTASGWYWRKTYTKNGQEVTSDKEIYYPDVASDFAVDFLRRHRNEPFYFYLSEHLIHGPIVRTPDSKPDASPRQLYDDNIAYLDKTVGKIVTELDKLGLRERTLIVFAADNGTSRVGYTPEHDPDKTSGKIGGRAVSGMKGQMLEGGARVPLVASWPATMPAGRVVSDLVDFSDVLPTFTDLAGATLPSGVKFDGRSFAPQLRGEKGNPRDWIFVQLGSNWYARNNGWKLNQAGELFSMKDAPFVEAPVAADSADPDAQAAREQLQSALDELNPAAGKTAPPDEDKAKRENRRRKRAAKNAGVSMLEQRTPLSAAGQFGQG